MVSYVKFAMWWWPFLVRLAKKLTYLRFYIKSKRHSDAILIKTLPLEHLHKKYEGTEY